MNGFSAGLRRLSASVKHDDGLTFRADEALRPQCLHYTACHLSRTTDQSGKLLAGYLDLHAVRMRHGVGLIKQIIDGVCDASCYVD